MIRGIDCSTPQPRHYAGAQWCGVYVAGDTPHVWTHEELGGLSAAGIKAALPIAVPPQDWPWPASDPTLTPDISGVLQGLCQAAHAWGLPAGSPLVLDCEAGQGDAMTLGPGRDWLPLVRRAWTQWCGLYGYVPWWYGAQRHQGITPAHRWIVADPFPGTGAMPPGASAVQYAQSPDGAVDLDMAANGLVWLATDLDGTIVIPPPTQETDMLLVLRQGTLGPWWLTDGISAHQVASPADLIVLAHDLRVPTTDRLSDAQLERMGIPVAPAPVASS